MAILDDKPIAKPRRRLRGRIIVGAVFLVAALLVANWIFESVRPRPDLALELKIKTGMTEAEVTEIFGCQPTVEKPYQIAQLQRNPGPGTRTYWYCDAAIVEVLFDDAGRVLGYGHFTYGFSEHPSRSALRNWLAFFGLGGLARMI